jgi:hypothetical protein
VANREREALIEVVAAGNYIEVKLLGTRVVNRQCDSGLDGSKQGSRVQAGEDDIRSAE